MRKYLILVCICLSLYFFDNVGAKETYVETAKNYELTAESYKKNGEITKANEYYINAAIYFVKAAEYYGKISDDSMKKAQQTSAEGKAIVMGSLYSSCFCLCAGPLLFVAQDGVGKLSQEKKLFKKSNENRVLSNECYLSATRNYEKAGKDEKARETLAATVKLDFFEAIKKLNINVFKTLLAKYDCENFKDNDGNSVLMIVAGKDYTIMVEALLAKGADVNMKKKDGTTALMLAAIKGHNKSVETLLTNGANADMKKKDGTTALMLAAIGCHSKTVKVLLGNGADVNIKNKLGQTVLSLVVAKRRQQLYKYRNKYSRIITLLKQAGDK